MFHKDTTYYNIHDRKKTIRNVTGAYDRIAPAHLLIRQRRPYAPPPSPAALHNRQGRLYCSPAFTARRPRYSFMAMAVTLRFPCPGVKAKASVTRSRLVM